MGAQAHANAIVLPVAKNMLKAKWQEEKVKIMESIHVAAPFTATYKGEVVLLEPQTWNNSYGWLGDMADGWAPSSEVWKTEIKMKVRESSFRPAPTIWLELAELRPKIQAGSSWQPILV